MIEPVTQDCRHYENDPITSFLRDAVTWAELDLAFAKGWNKNQTEPVRGLALQGFESRLEKARATWKAWMNRPTEDDELTRLLETWARSVNTCPRNHPHLGSCNSRFGKFYITWMRDEL
jgi:hypothetical protein